MIELINDNYNAGYGSSQIITNNVLYNGGFIKTNNTCISVLCMHCIFPDLYVNLYVFHCYMSYKRSPM